MSIVRKVGSAIKRAALFVPRKIGSVVQKKPLQIERLGVGKFRVADRVTVFNKPPIKFYSSPIPIAPQHLIDPHVTKAKAIVWTEFDPLFGGRIVNQKDLDAHQKALAAQRKQRWDAVRSRKDATRTVFKPSIGRKDPLISSYIMMLLSEGANWVLNCISGASNTLDYRNARTVFKLGIPMSGGGLDRFQIASTEHRSRSWECDPRQLALNGKGTAMVTGPNTYSAKQERVDRAIAGLPPNTHVVIKDADQ